MPYYLPCLCHLIKYRNVEYPLGGFLFPRLKGIFTPKISFRCVLLLAIFCSLGFRGVIMYFLSDQRVLQRSTEESFNYLLPSVLK